MKKALLALVATVAGIAGLLSFKTHGTERSGVTAQPTALPPGERTVTGKVANTAYGPVQVQAVYRGKRIVAVNIRSTSSAGAWYSIRLLIPQTPRSPHL